MLPARTSSELIVLFASLPAFDLATPIRTRIKREPATRPPATSICAAAELMREQCVSSVLLVKHGQLFGLAIDRDLRNRVVAQGLNIDGQRSPHCHAGAADAGRLQPPSLPRRHDGHDRRLAPAMPAPGEISEQRARWASAIN